MEGLRSVCERNAIEMPNIKWWRRKKRKWEWVGGKLWPPNMFASTQEIEFYTAEKYLLLPPRKSMFDILGNRRQCLPCQHWRRWTSIGGYTGVDQTSRGTAPKFKSIQNSDWTLKSYCWAGSGNFSIRSELSRVGYFSSFSSFLKRTKQMSFSMIFLLLFYMLAFLNYKDTRSSLQSLFLKNKPNCKNSHAQVFNHIFLLMSRKYVCAANQKYVRDQYEKLIVAWHHHLYIPTARKSVAETSEWSLFYLCINYFLTK